MKKTFFFLSFLITLNVFSQSDDKSQALTLSNLNDWCSADSIYTTVGATPDGSRPSMWKSGPNNNVWFKFQAESNIIDILLKTYENEGTLQYPFIALWDSSGQEIVSNRYPNVKINNDIRVSANNLIQDKWYYISVDNEIGYAGTFTLCITNDSISNDIPEGAIELSTTYSSSLEGHSTFYASSDGDRPSNWIDGPNYNIWYKFQATTESMTIDVKTNETEGTLQYAQLALWDSTLNEMKSEYAINWGDDLKLVYGNLNIDEWYYISIDNRLNPSSGLAYQGTFTLSLNDDHVYDYKQYAYEITNINDWCSQNSEFTNEYCTADGTRPSMWLDGPNKNKWFKFQAQSNIIDILLKTDDNEGTLQKSYLALWDSAGQEITSTRYPNGKINNDIRVSANNLNIGDWYYISVDNQSGFEGTFSLCVTDDTISNDIPEGAIELSTNYSSSLEEFTTYFASGDGMQPANWTDGPNYNVWFKFQAITESMTINLNTYLDEGTMQYAKLALWDTNFNEINSVESGGYSNDIELVAGNLTAGMWYFITVDNRLNNSSGSAYQGTFSLSLSDAHVYDYKQYAYEITNVSNWCSQDAEFTNENGSPDGVKPDFWLDGPNKNKWFKFQAQSNIIDILLKTDDNEGTLQKSYLALWDSAGQEITSTRYPNGKINNDIRVSANNLNMGDWYYISVDNQSGFEGTFSLCITDNTISNDIPEGAIELSTNYSSSLQEFSTYFASGDGSKPTNWTNGPNYNVWFKFQAITESMTVNLNTYQDEGTMQYAQLAIWDASFNEVNSANALYYYDLELKAGNLTPGSWYYISVDNGLNAPSGAAYQGTFTLSLDDAHQYDFKEYGHELADISNWNSVDAEFTTVDGTPDESKPSCWTYGPTFNKWFKFKASETGRISIEMESGDSKGNLRRGYLALWSENDVLDCDMYSTTYDILAVSSNNLTPGEYYYISVDNYKYSSYCGTFTLRVDDFQPDFIVETDPFSENGDVTLEVSSGDEPYSFLWSDSSTSQNRTGLTDGTYSVTITGNSGAKIVKSIDVVSENISISNENYIITTMARFPVASENVFDSLHSDSVTMAIQYFDGLGRLSQNVQVKESPRKRDIVQHFEYDDLGRQVFDYMIFTKNNNGNFVANPLSELDYFYSGVEANIQATDYYFSEKYFDYSPLNRVMEQGAPGAVWQIDKDINDTSTRNGNTLRFRYLFNTTGEVRVLEPFTQGIQSNGYYAENILYKNVIIDANGNKTCEFKDKEGKVILKQTYLVNDTLSTYNVYDDFNLLRYVIPPEAVEQLGSGGWQIYKDSSIYLNYCYGYSYDERHRMITKKIPGADPVYMLYNKLDEMVLSQDGNLRQDNEWLFTKYDAFGNPIITGKYYTAETNRETIEDSINAASSIYEVRDTSNYVTNMGYTNNAFPTTWESIHTVTYFDDYNFGDGYTYNYTQPNSNYDTTKYDFTEGMITGEKINILGTSNYLTNVYFYDEYGRLLQSYNENYLNGTQTTTNHYLFSGEIDWNHIEQVAEIKTGIYDTITLEKQFTYDHAGRPLKTILSINDEDEFIVSSLEYNELSELVAKDLHSTDSGNSYLQSIDYKYNERGWLTHINDPVQLDADSYDDNNDLFGMQLLYNEGFSDLGGIPQYNGNISGYKWQGSYIPGLRGYGYGYDKANRINYANYGEYEAANWNLHDEAFSVKSIEYDHNGNIKNLNRIRFQDPAVKTDLYVDELDYTYKGNQLYDLTKTTLTYSPGEMLPGGGGGGTTTPIEHYFYDNNGNLVRDSVKGITDIDYNHLNLPERVELNTTSTERAISFGYDALGTKYKKSVSYALMGNPADVDHLYYMENFVYMENEGDTAVSLNYILDNEGRIVNNSGTWRYEYFIKDHLGNTRLVFCDNNEDGVITVSGDSNEVYQETNYYPFGMTFKEQNINYSNKYLFGGKELQDDFELDWLDFGWRMYDPALGRWHNADPLAELDYDWSPYRYGYDNPIIYTDPDGLWEFNVVGNEEDGYRVVINWQEGDNLETLAEQTGYSVDEIKSFYGEATIEGLEAGNQMSLTEFGGMLEGINAALNESNTLDCNCWGTALEYGETGKVDPQGGIPDPNSADTRLQQNFEETSNPKTGDVVRYAEEDGYKGADLNGNGKANQKNEAIKQQYGIANDGSKKGGTSHFATFLIKNNKGTQVFTKNGWFVKWKVSYQKNLPSSYGSPTGINGGSSTYKKK